MQVIAVPACVPAAGILCLETTLDGNRGVTFPESAAVPVALQPRPTWRGAAPLTLTSRAWCRWQRLSHKDAALLGGARCCHTQYQNDAPPTAIRQGIFEMTVRGRRIMRRLSYSKHSSFDLSRGTRTCRRLPDGLPPRGFRNNSL